MHLMPAVAAVSVNRACENKNHGEKGQQLFEKTCHAFVLLFMCCVHLQQTS